MIIGQKTVTFQGGGLGASTSPTNAVKRMQQLLMVVAELTGDTKYRPCGVDGKVGKCTVFALVQVVRSGLAKIPVVSTILGTLDTIIKNVPGVGGALDSILNDYGTYKYAMAGAEEIFPAETMEIYETVRDAANAVAPILEAVANKLQLPDFPGGMTTMQINPDALVQQQITYPPGTVAVRDPLLGKYILLAPSA